MSPSWHKRLFVAISPERLSMIKLGRGFKPKLMAKHDEEITQTGKQAPWQTALDRFSELLSESEWQGAEVNVVLSNRLARFSAMTFAPQLKTYGAQEAFARHSLIQTHGAAVEQWELRIQHGKAGQPSLVSAIDQALLNGLQQACAAHKLKLNLVTPCLIPIFNRFRKTFQNDPAWLVISEPGYSVLALMSDGEFSVINGVSHSSIDELPVLLDRENLVSALTEPCNSVYLYAPGISTLPKVRYDISKLEFAVPDGFPAQSDGLHAMTMSECL